MGDAMVSFGVAERRESLLRGRILRLLVLIILFALFALGGFGFVRHLEQRRVEEAVEGVLGLSEGVEAALSKKFVQNIEGIDETEMALRGLAGEIEALMEMRRFCEMKNCEEMTNFAEKAKALAENLSILGFIYRGKEMECNAATAGAKELCEEVLSLRAEGESFRQRYSEGDGADVVENYGEIMKKWDALEVKYQKMSEVELYGVEAEEILGVFEELR